MRICIGADRWGARQIGMLVLAGIIGIGVGTADAQVLRRAAGGALGGAAIANASGGDSGKGAAWGAAGGAVKGVVQKKREAAAANERQTELEQAYEMGYDDAMQGRAATEVGSPSSEAKGGQIARGAGRGALHGAAIGSLSDGDAGKGAAWGAGGGAIKGVVQKKRDEETAAKQEAALNNAYQEGYREALRTKKGMRAVEQ